MRSAAAATGNSDEPDELGQLPYAEHRYVDESYYYFEDKEALFGQGTLRRAQVRQQDLLPLRGRGGALWARVPCAERRYGDMSYYYLVDEEALYGQGTAAGAIAVICGIVW